MRKHGKSTMTDWQTEPHPVPPELEPDYVHALPPDHVVDTDFQDEDQHPTGAWLTIGDVVETDVWKRIREQLQQEIREGQHP